MGAYTKFQVALSYFPDNIDKPDSAVHRLRQWIMRNQLLCAELAKKQRAETEAQYEMIRLYVEYTANNMPDDISGKICSNIIGVVNEYVKDARQRLNARLGRSESYDSPDFSPIPYPKQS